MSSIVQFGDPTSPEDYTQDPTAVDPTLDPTNVDPTLQDPTANQVEVQQPIIDDDEEDRLLLQIKDSFEQEDRLPRQVLLRKLKKNELFWDGKQRIYWSEFEENYKSIDDLSLKEREELNIKDFDRVINIYKPLGESVIAALSIESPATQFFPDDADNPDDIATSKALSKIAELVQKHNRSDLLFIKALFILWNQGMIAGYNYIHKHESYGVIKTPQYQDTPVTTMQLNPQTNMAEPVTEIVSKLVGYSEEPKARECLEVYGQTHVQVPTWVRDQKHTPYIKLEFEQHTSLIRATFPDKFDEVKDEKMGDNYDERYARAKTFDQERSEVVTVKTIWYRPWALAACKDKEKFNFLVGKYPKGLRITVINDKVFEKVEEDLDDHWTLSFPILSDTLQAEPMGQGAIEIQELRNDGINLIDQKMRHAITETFADEKVLNFAAYNNAEKVPGQMFPVTAPAGGRIQDGFFSTKTSSLSSEDDVYISRLDKDGQFVTGAFPSVYGGAQIGGSKTLGEYAQSRSQALQRLSTYWKMLGWFWNEFQARAAKEYANNMREDERIVQKHGDSFINVWIRRAELKGKIGSVEPESSGNFPMTSAQKKDLLTALIQYKDPTIASVIFHPENGELTRDALGMPELYIPGQGDRNRQLYEFQQLCMIDTTAVTDPAQLPTVHIQPLIDDHQVHIQVLKSQLVSERGMLLQEENPAAYANCLAHLQEHIQFAQQQMAQATPTSQPNQPEQTNTNTTNAS